LAFDRSKWVWMNGELIPWDRATIHVSAHGLHYGSGVFEGMRCYETPAGPAVFRMRAHFKRFFASARTYGMALPYTKEQLADAVFRLVRRNGFRSCYVRPICYYGSDSLAVQPLKCPVEVAIFAWPWAPLLGVEKQTEGVRVTISPWVKFHSSMMPTTAKACGQYLNSMIALNEAVRHGFDEAILLDTDGNLAEGSGENIFIVRGGTVATNNDTDSILMGITRDSVIQIAQDLDYPVHIRTLRIEDLLSADEAFFTGTASEVTPIIEVDGRKIGTGVRGPVTERIQKAFFNATAGKEPKYKNWLELVVKTSSPRRSVRSTTGTGRARSGRTGIRNTVAD
jgi:branched-chain amino acid aminotransferase